MGTETANAEFLARPVRRIYKRGKQKELKSGFEKNLIESPSSFESAISEAAEVYLIGSYESLCPKVSSLNC